MQLFHRSVMDRAFSDAVRQGRMVFLAGPRQIGKTTAVRRFLAAQGQEGLYYNWDAQTVKRRYASDPLFFLKDIPPEAPHCWVALDEIHKYPKWKNLLKGYYDEWKERIRFIVTGSARLDFFRKSGDSLVGRYFLFKMLPLGVREIVPSTAGRCAEWFPAEELKVVPSVSAQIGHAVDHLLALTGYPEPFAAGTRDFYARWQENHISLILQEDLRDLTKIVQVKKLETLLYLLPERVGSPLSLNALRQPLEVAHGSIRLWLNALKTVYLIFSISPWTAHLSRSVLKEEKYYFWDWGMVEDTGTRFENFMAVQLARVVASWNERGKGPFHLHYLRTKEGREVDFAVADRKKVFLLVEVKETDTSLSVHLPLFQTKVQAPLAVQVVNKKGYCEMKGKGLYVMGVDRFLSLLP